MILNEDFYLQPSIICLLDEENKVQFYQLAHPSSMKHVTATERKDIARVTFQLECLSTPQNGSWFSMWHVYAISSVLNRPIISVYPDSNKRTRPAFHKNVFPRLGVQSQTRDVVPVIVMWTHTRNRVCSRTW